MFDLKRDNPADIGATIACNIAVETIDNLSPGAAQKTIAKATEALKRRKQAPAG